MGPLRYPGYWRGSTNEGGACGAVVGPELVGVPRAMGPWVLVVVVEVVGRAFQLTRQ